MDDFSWTWKRHQKNPILPAVPGTWMESQTANPDIALYGGVYHLYFRGQEGGHDRVGLAVSPENEFDGVTWKILPEPVIDVGGPGDWDETHVLDPAAVRVGSTVFLYYSAVCPRCPRSICLAVSQDGKRFVKHPRNPVAIGGAPEVVYDGRLFYLYFWKDRSGGGFEIHLAVSGDGYGFREPTGEPCLPAGPAGSWDSHTVETPRIFKEGGLYYMMYCGSDRFDDYPPAAGLAVSRNLRHWKKYEGNPIFERGEAGAWDEGAVWFPTVRKVNGRYWMWYEGYGGGTSRIEPYGDYLTAARSQIGLAMLDAPYFYVKP
ncbi:MAG: hypothetical protein JW843_02385 [Candidatus Aminicenantes bacterium]|nr:hypothetical protein [Candidatus Aminicenantes bacterium]